MTEVLEFALPGVCPALKNNRNPILDKHKRFRGTRPAEVVLQYIRTAKDKMQRQLPEGFQVLTPQKEVAVVTLIGVVSKTYPKTLPKSDLDNAHTTLQECLFTAKTDLGPVLQDDRMVSESHSLRFIVREEEMAYSRIWLWVIEDPQSHQKCMAETLATVYRIKERHELALMETEFVHA